jgi:GNAT superfamily N-acetyltransferase
MNPRLLLPALPGADFVALAAMFSDLEPEPTTAAHLRDYYAGSQSWFLQKLAVDAQDSLLGFYFAARDQEDPTVAYLSLYVKPGARRQGAGEFRIHKIVAVWQDAGELYVLSPCGRCREFIRQVHPANLETEVILDLERTVRLSELLPYADWFQKTGLRRDG